MSATFSTPATAPGMAARSRGSGLVAIIKRWWIASLTRRIEEAAIAHLSSMSDRELKDIGLTRSQIPWAVKGEPGRGPFVPHY